MYKDKKWLQKQYIDMRLSTLSIAKKCNVSEETIRRYLHIFTIPIRQRNELALGKKYSAEHKKNISNALKGIGGGNKNPNWKGKHFHKRSGYVYIKVPNHPFAHKDGYYEEHRLVAEKYLKRYLTPNEVVHHINEVRDDNRPENLHVFTNNAIHLKLHKSRMIASIKSNIV